MGRDLPGQLGQRLGQGGNPLPGGGAEGEHRRVFQEGALGQGGQLLQGQRPLLRLGQVGFGQGHQPPCHPQQL